MNDTDRSSTNFTTLTCNIQVLNLPYLQTPSVEFSHSLTHLMAVRRWANKEMLLCPIRSFINRLLPLSPVSCLLGPQPHIIAITKSRLSLYPVLEKRGAFVLRGLGRTKGKQDVLESVEID